MNNLQVIDNFTSLPMELIELILLELNGISVARVMVAYDAIPNEGFLFRYSLKYYGNVDNLEGIIKLPMVMGHFLTDILGMRFIDRRLIRSYPEPPKPYKAGLPNEYIESLPGVNQITRIPDNWVPPIFNFIDE